MFFMGVSHGWELTPNKCFVGKVTFLKPAYVNIPVGQRFQASLAAEIIQVLVGGLADWSDATGLVVG